MGENRYFQKALSDFTYETASGGAIRHLADAGFTVRQIMEQLDFPTPYGRVQKAVWEHLIRQGIILLERPGSGGPRESAHYVREYDQYGRASFRRIVVREEGEIAAGWAVQAVGSGEKTAEEFAALLWGKRAANGAENAYASFDFGLMPGENPVQYETALSALDGHGKEYVAGLPWEGRRVYHKLDSNGMGILLQLYGAGQYRGECFFLKSREILQVGCPEPAG